MGYINYNGEKERCENMTDKELENVLTEVKKARADIMSTHTEVLELVRMMTTALTEQRLTVQYLMTNTDLVEAKVDYGTAFLGNKLGSKVYDDKTVADINDYVKYIMDDKQKVINMFEDVDTYGDKNK